MEINELLTKHKNKIINIIALIVAAYIALALYSKQAKDLSMLLAKKDIEIKKNEVLGSIGKWDETIKAYKGQINNKDVSLLIDTLSNIAKASSAKILSIRPIEESSSQYYMRYPFGLKVLVDDYHALGKFISNLESDPDIFNVEVANARTQSEGQGEEERVQLVVELRISTILVKH